MLAELKELMDYRARYFTDAPGGAPKILALGLSSRKNLCIHPWVSGAGRCRLDAGCGARGRVDGAVAVAVWAG